MNLGVYLTRSARYWPDLPAVVCGDRHWTFAELEADANRLAAALLARGLRPGDSVGSLAWNRGELIVVEFALYKAGLLRAPINARLGRAEIAHILGYAPVRALLFDAAHREDALAARTVAEVDGLAVEFENGYAELLAAGSPEPVCVEVAEQAPAVLNFTSGSTGSLKAAVQTHGNRLANLRKQLMSESRPRAGSRYLACGPITHAAGMPLLACVFAGTTIHVLPGWDPEAFLATVERERIDTTFLVPAMLNSVLGHPVGPTTTCPAWSICGSAVPRSPRSGCARRSPPSARWWARATGSPRPPR